MNQTVPFPSDPASAPKKSGSGKLIALIVGICLLLFVAFVGGILFFVFNMLRSNGAYQGALERARKSPEAIVALGEPIKDGYFMSGNAPITSPDVSYWIAGAVVAVAALLFVYVMPQALRGTSKP